MTISHKLQLLHSFYSNTNEKTFCKYFLIGHEFLENNYDDSHVKYDLPPLEDFGINGFNCCDYWHSQFRFNPVTEEMTSLDLFVYWLTKITDELGLDLQIDFSRYLITPEEHDKALRHLIDCGFIERIK